jgi:superfamily II DNA or RNA helicase
LARVHLREWQRDAIARWKSAGNRGIVSVVTGAGKTVFALACVDRLRPPSTLVVVPSTALLDQWWEAAATYFDLALDEVNIVSSRRSFQVGAINIVVLNTAAKAWERIGRHECFLIVDECHKAAAPQLRAALNVRTLATLGLSATPERPYDDGLEEVLIPALGPVVFSYGYEEALRDGVIVPFEVSNVIFDLEPERQREYDRLTAAIARTIGRLGVESEAAVRLLLKRTRLLNLSLERIRLTLKLVVRHRGRRVLIFHEDIEACNLIHEMLSHAGIRSGVYHSGLPLRSRAEMLRAYREGASEVLVTCRALDEGFNVPETEIGIIAASTATDRQRIQRLGRIVRPSEGKERAMIYTLVATEPEISRLRREEERLGGIATVNWVRL